VVAVTSAVIDLPVVTGLGSRISMTSLEGVLRTAVKAAEVAARCVSAVVIDRYSPRLMARLWPGDS
jgi:hypothetical protein